MNIELAARIYWSAAYFANRAASRDHSNARRVLRRVAGMTTGRVRALAIKQLEKMNGTASRHPTA